MGKCGKSSENRLIISFFVANGHTSRLVERKGKRLKSVRQPAYNRGANRSIPVVLPAYLYLVSASGFQDMDQVSLVNPDETGHGGTSQSTLSRLCIDAVH